MVQQMIPEPAIALIVQDNLDIACSSIEKAAMERSLTDVDEGFAQAYELRRRHREVSSGTIFNYTPLTSYLAPECSGLLGSICSTIEFLFYPT